MTTRFVYLSTEGARRPVRLTAGPLPARRFPAAGLRPTADPGVVEIEPSCRELLAVAWGRAADAVTRRPPGCPHPDLRAVWGQWVRVAVQLARQFPTDMEGWTGAMLADGVARRLVAVTDMLARWREDRASRFEDGVEAVTGALPRAAEEAGAGDLVMALRRVFVWDKRAAVDARPGLLEARWVHWPLAGRPLLSLHLSHQGWQPSGPSDAAATPGEVLVQPATALREGAVQR